MKEEGAVCEEATRNDLDYAAKPNMVGHHSAFSSQRQLGPCRTAHEQYKSSDSELKKEIPAKKSEEDRGHDPEGHPAEISRALRGQEGERPRSQCRRDHRHADPRAASRTRCRVDRAPQAA